MKLTLSRHAKDATKERRITTAWMERVVFQPEKLESDRLDPELEHRLGRIIEYGNRVLRVIVNETKNPPMIVTAYFDRKMRNKL